MTSPHEPQHVDILLRILVEHGPDSAAFEASAQADCPECQELWREMTLMEDLMQTAREHEQEEIQQLHAILEPGPAALDDYPEGRAERHLRGLIDRDTRARRLWRRPAVWAAAAAAVLAALWWLWPEPSLDLPDTPLGGAGAVEITAPTGDAPSFERFRWKGELPPGGTFEVVVRSTGGEVLLRSRPLRQNEWAPTAAEVAGLPAAIEWTVQVVRPEGTRSHAESDSATAHRR